jgi:hypothetical protein
MPEPRTGRLSDPQHRTPRREIGRSVSVAHACRHRAARLVTIASGGAPVSDRHLGRQIAKGGRHEASNRP